MKLKFVAVTAVALTAWQGIPAYAWGPGGHQQVADIAWSGLNSKAKSTIKTILMASDPLFQPKNPNKVSSVRGAFRFSATMPDVIKSNTHTAFESLIASHQDDFSALNDPLVGEKERKRCKTFHYYDTPISSTDAPPLDKDGHTPQIAKSNASAALREAIKRTKEIQAQATISSQDRLEEAWWLGWIEHIVGDLHQPLHCAQNFAFSHAGDGGGNGFKITDPISGGETSLHSFWDGSIDRVKLQESKVDGHSSRFEPVSTRWRRDEGIAQTSSIAMEMDEMKWIATGASLAKENAYTEIKPLGVPLDSYLTRQTTVVKRQAVLGGLRLANLLNSLLG